MKAVSIVLSILIMIVGATSGYLILNRKRAIDIKSLDAIAIRRVINDYTDNIVKKCASASYKPTCYEDEVPKLMDKITMEQVFDVTRAIQDEDKSYAYCHVLGHKLAEKETAKDPSRWKEVVTRCPSGLCSNGCIHGAFQERFRREVLSADEVDKIKGDIKNVCEPRQNWSPTGLEQGTCYHALGHLLMYITGADIKKSVKVCEEVAIKDNGRDWSKLCFDGTFMQIFQPLETEDFVLVAGKQPKKEELPKYCSQFSPEQKSSCWEEGWPLYRSEIMTPKGVVDFCSKSFLKTPSDIDRCYISMFYVMTAQVQFDIEKLRDYCAGLPANLQGHCYANVASRLIETDYRNASESASLCMGISNTKDKEQCFKELLFYSTYNFHAGSQEFFQLCNSLPDTWKNQCLAGYRPGPSQN